MSIAEQLTIWIGSEDSLAGWLALAGSAAIEYVFPPFPGDFVTILGAVMITAASWTWAGVLSALMVGSVIGAALTFELGVRWSRRRRPRPDNAAVIDRLVARFRRHGAVYLILNRFVPGIRSAFFIAAGLAGMRRGPVYLCAALSSLLWNLALMVVGVLLGANLDRLERVVMTYTVGFVAVVAGLIVLAIGVGWWRRRRASSR